MAINLNFDDKLLLKASFIISVLGIVLLFIFSYQIVLPETRLNETAGMDGKLVNVYGSVKSVSLKNVSDEDGNTREYTLVTIEQVNTVSVYADELLNISKGDRLGIRGRLQDTIIFAEDIKRYGG